MNPTRLSRELRLGRSPDLTRRRWIVGLSLLNAAIGGVVAAYQMGMVRRLPDPPIGPFDSSRVDASDYAYKRLDVPDGLLMTATYAGTALLAGAGGERRAEDASMLPLAMAGKAVYDVVTTVRLAREEWAENRAFCAYCQAATVATLAIAALALPEAGRALGAISGDASSDPRRLPRRFG